MNGIMRYLFKLFIALCGVGLIGYSHYFMDKNLILTAIGGIVIAVSGIQIHVITYEKDFEPRQVTIGIKEWITHLFNKPKT